MGEFWISLARMVIDHLIANAIPPRRPPTIRQGRGLFRVAVYLPLLRLRRRLVRVSACKHPMSQSRLQAVGGTAANGRGCKLDVFEGGVYRPTGESDWNTVVHPTGVAVAGRLWDVVYRVAGAPRRGIAAATARSTPFTASALLNTRATSGSSITAMAPGAILDANRLGFDFV